MTVALVALTASVPFTGSHPAAADMEAPARAAVETAALQKGSGNLPITAAVDAPVVLQSPELPTGCESVALTIVLASLGFDLGKTEIAQEWLPRSDNDFVTAFMGDPSSADGHSCMAPAIVQTADAYLAAHGSALRARDLTGSSFAAVLAEVAQGHPVLAWCTIDLNETGDAYATQRAFDRTYRLYPNSHCVVVRGYDLAAGTVLASDPLAGDTTYDLALFATRYYQLGSQAAVIG